MNKNVLERIGLWILTLLPTIGTIVAIALIFRYGYVRAEDLVLLAATFVLTALGITIGYHRMVTHQSFKPTPIVKFVFLALGSMAVQGPVLFWAGVHWKHHAHADKEEDPHSPWWWKGINLHVPTGGWWRHLKLRALAFWHAHMGWLFSKSVDWEGIDSGNLKLRSDPMIVFMSRTFVFWVVARFVICYLIGGWSGFLWGGCVSLLLNQHITYLVNSATHILGTRDYETNDESRNNWVIGILAMGEGWHNNHHKFMWSARHGLKWWQFDMSYIVIRTMEKLRLVSNVRVPRASQIHDLER